MSYRKRTKSNSFTMLTRQITRSAAWRDLRPPARALYLELRERYNGHNNGVIGLGVRQAAEALNVSKDTASRSFIELEEHGFIEPTTKGYLVGSRATEWLLTELRDDRTNHRPTADFLSWQPENLERRPTTRTLRPTTRTQTENLTGETVLRPTTRTQTPIPSGFASDHKDTSRYTIPRGTDKTGEKARRQGTRDRRASPAETLSSTATRAVPSSGGNHLSSALVASATGGNAK